MAHSFLPELHCVYSSLSVSTAWTVFSHVMTRDTVYINMKNCETCNASGIYWRICWICPSHQTNTGVDARHLLPHHLSSISWEAEVRSHYMVIKISKKCWDCCDCWNWSPGAGNRRGMLGMTHAIETLFESTGHQTQSNNGIAYCSFCFLNRKNFSRFQSNVMVTMKRTSGLHLVFSIWGSFKLLINLCCFHLDWIYPSWWCSRYCFICTIQFLHI